MFVLKAFKHDTSKILKQRGLQDNGDVQRFIDTECLRGCEPFMPKDTGALIESGTINTQIGSGTLKYRTVYARRWYYMPAKFQGAPQRGNYWFERMKQQKKKQILNGAKMVAGAK